MMNEWRTRDGRYVVVRDVRDDDYERDGRYVVVRADDDDEQDDGRYVVVHDDERMNE